MGVPKNGWFISWKIPSRNGWFRGNPHLWNPYNVTGMSTKRGDVDQNPLWGYSSTRSSEGLRPTHFTLVVCCSHPLFWGSVACPTPIRNATLNQEQEVGSTPHKQQPKQAALSKNIPWSSSSCRVYDISRYFHWNNFEDPLVAQPPWRYWMAKVTVFRGLKSRVLPIPAAIFNLKIGIQNKSFCCSHSSFLDSLGSAIFQHTQVFGDLANTDWLLIAFPVESPPAQLPNSPSSRSINKVGTSPSKCWRFFWCFNHQERGGNQQKSMGWSMGTIYRKLWI